MTDTAEPTITIREMREYIEERLTWLGGFMACSERAAREASYRDVLAYLDQREKEGEHER